MTFSGHTNHVRESSQRSGRAGARIDRIILHHAASTNGAGVVDMMVRKTRTVSSNYVIANDGTVYGVVPEEYRAWTSGSASDGGKGAAFDRRAITFEVANASAGGAWPISEASYVSLAKVVADASKRYGIPLDRDHVLGHRELWSRFRASYATACPGGMDIDRVVRDARAIVGGAVIAPATPAKPVGVAPPFPLPASSYFGPKSGPVQSVSGYYSHREDARVAQRRMQARGYTFPRFGIDGLYGDEWAANIRHFQADKGLHVDGLLGVDTWTALWTLPVT